MRNIVFIGMPGSGKSAVGQIVARWLGWPLLDTDELVARRAGRSIAEIFAQEGEPGFRRLEREAVRQVARAQRAVVATGGGVILNPDNMSDLRRRGWIVALTADADVLLARVGQDGGGRPLLAADPAGRMQALLAERAPRYAEADLVLDGTRPAEDLAREVLAALQRQAVETVTVDLGERAYPVRVGDGILDLLGWELRGRFPGGQAVVLTHPRLAIRFGARVERVLGAAGFTRVAVAVPEGERSKSLRRAAAVIDQMAAAGIDRSGIVIALGGGVIGDLAGFIAGTYMRGLALVQVPTTLLAQVDSAIGGKAAVNHPRAKNLIGVFHQPALVLADVDAVRALGVREVRSGLAEVIKYGMACDAEVLAFVESHLEALLRRESEALVRCVRSCAAVKARIVAEDERERGPRRLLNYGHTVGHALEITAEGALAHGEAIAVGMQVEARLAERLGLAPAETVERQETLLRRAGLPTRVPADGPPDAAILEAIRLDKKVQRGEWRFTLVREPGRGVIDQVVPEALVREVLAACRASS